jgi:hypothetical protein
MPENSTKPLSPAKIRAFRRNKNTKLKEVLRRYYVGPLQAERALAELAPSLAPPSAPCVLPRRIWMYWHDGWDKAPEIAKLCLQSWRQRNPGYEVRALDHASLGSVFDDPPVHKGASKLSGFANRVRLRLLRTHGGIWADATNFCTKPVDDWIHAHVAPAHFFAYVLPNAERPIATWFLAACPRAPLVAAWEEIVSLYFARIEAEERKVHAYFYMPYIFEFAVFGHAQLRAQWDAMPKVPVADSGFVAHIAGLQQTHAPAPSLVRAKRKRIALALADTPMQKLTWKGQVKENTPVAQELLDILRENLAGVPFKGRLKLRRGD